MNVKLWFTGNGSVSNDQGQQRQPDMTVTGTFTTESTDYKVVTNSVPSDEWHFPKVVTNSVPSDEWHFPFGAVSGVLLDS
jgi:hypothetical protein